MVIILGREKSKMKIKSKLGLCNKKWCFRKAIFDVKIPRIDYKIQLCKKHFKKFKELNMLNKQYSEGSNVYQAGRDNNIMNIYK